MVRVTVRRITVGQGLRCSKHFSSGVGLGGKAMEVYFLLLMANNASLSGEKLQSSILRSVTLLTSRCGRWRGPRRAVVSRPRSQSAQGPQSPPPPGWSPSEEEHSRPQAQSSSAAGPLEPRAPSSVTVARRRVPLVLFNDIIFIHEKIFLYQLKEALDFLYTVNLPVPRFSLLLLLYFLSFVNFLL